MRIAQINLPQYDNDGHNLINVHSLLSEALISAFGGFTAHEAIGAWKGPTQTYAERIMCYQIAMDDTPFNRQRVQEIALHFGDKANQEAVFVILPNGEALVLDVVTTEGIHP